MFTFTGWIMNILSLLKKYILKVFFCWPHTRVNKLLPPAEFFVPNENDNLLETGPYDDFKWPRKQNSSDDVKEICIQIIENKKELCELDLRDINEIQVYNCPKITRVPDICNFPLLETLKISHCSIKSCRTYFPDGLRVLSMTYCMMTEFAPQNMPTNLAQLDLSFNSLKKIPDCLASTSMNIKLHHNDFWFSMYSAINFSLLGKGVGKELVRAYQLNLVSTMRIRDAAVEFEQLLLHEDAEVIWQCIGRDQPTGTKRHDRTTADNKQNVHLESVQDGTCRSIAKISKRLQMPLHDAIKMLALSRELKKQVLADCTLPKHSKYNVTFQNILLSVCWTIDQMNMQEHRATLIAILRDELKDGSNTCLTGKITRTVNALNGFDDDVKINISRTEELSNSIIALRKRHAIIYTDVNEYIAETVPAVCQLLEDNCVPEPAQNVWLEYV